ncbi:MAG: response regulator transcription factor [Pirellulales bacterium]
MSINILVADDHEMVRTGLSSLLEGSNIRIVAEAGSGDEAITQAKKHRPDVILLDIRMPGPDGLATLEKIHNEIPESRVVMLSTYDNPTYVARSVALGACDYVLKGSSRGDLIAAIEAAHKGESPTTGGQMKKVATAMETRQNKHDDVPLTNREAQVLKHIALGLSNREIAKSLEISIETVKEHVQNILRKISVTDRTQAAVWAVRRNLV